MTKLRRLVVDIVSVVSLLLCALASAMWIRSYRVTETWDLIRIPRTTTSCVIVFTDDACTLFSATGRCGIRIGAVTLGEPRYIGLSLSDNMRVADYKAIMRPTAWNQIVLQGAVTQWERAGFGFASTGGKAIHDIQVSFCPYWAIAFPAAIAPFIRLGRLVRGRTRSRPGMCITCGYDLRATLERCPECGPVSMNKPA